MSTSKAMNFKVCVKKIYRRHLSSSLVVISLSRVLTPQYQASLEYRELMVVVMEAEAGLQAVARMKAMMKNMMATNVMAGAMQAMKAMRAMKAANAVVPNTGGDGNARRCGRGRRTRNNGYGFAAAGDDPATAACAGV